MHGFIYKMVYTLAWYFFCSDYTKALHSLSGDLHAWSGFGSQVKYRETHNAVCVYSSNSSKCRRCNNKAEGGGEPMIGFGLVAFYTALPSLSFSRPDQWTIGSSPSTIVRIFLLEILQNRNQDILIENIGISQRWSEATSLSSSYSP